jgi:hypothetical protein
VKGGERRGAWARVAGLLVLGGGEVTSLGGVAAEVELNEGVFGVEACCVREDF